MLNSRSRTSSMVVASMYFKMQFIIINSTSRRVSEYCTNVFRNTYPWGLSGSNDAMYCPGESFRAMGTDPSPLQIINAPQEHSGCEHRKGYYRLLD